MALAAGEEKTVYFDACVPAFDTEYTKIYNQAEIFVDWTQKVSVSSDSVLDDTTPVYVLDKPFKAVLCVDVKFLPGPARGFNDFFPCGQSENNFF